MRRTSFSVANRNAAYRSLGCTSGENCTIGQSLLTAA